MFTTRKKLTSILLITLLEAGCDPTDEQNEDTSTGTESSADGSSGDEPTEPHALDPWEFSTPESDPYAAAHLCIDACSDLVSCWTSCVKAGKTTNCLQSGYTCDSGQVCGNKVCDLHETCSSCPDDCKPKPIVTLDYDSKCWPTGAVSNPTWKFNPDASPPCNTPLQCGDWQMKCTTYEITNTKICWETTQSKKAIESHTEYQYSCGYPGSYVSTVCN